MRIQTPAGKFIIREAIEKDLPSLVHVHVTSWNATYANYHPKPSVELRTRQWQEAFAINRDNWFCYVAEKEGGTIAGFATGNDFNDPSLPYRGQLNKIHFLKTYHRLGLGKKLVGIVAERFLRNGIRTMILFADPENPNIVFYEKLGGEKIYDDAGKFHGAFGWIDIEPLVELCKR